MEIISVSGIFIFFQLNSRKATETEMETFKSLIEYLRSLSQFCICYLSYSGVPNGLHWVVQSGRSFLQFARVVAASRVLSRLLRSCAV